MRISCILISVYLILFGTEVSRAGLLSLLADTAEAYRARNEIINHRTHEFGSAESTVIYFNNADFPSPPPRRLTQDQDILPSQTLMKECAIH